MRGWLKRIAEGLKAALLISKVADVARRDVTKLVSRLFQSE